MVALSGYLKITRPLNLVIVALIQIVMYYKIMLPVFDAYGVKSVFGAYLFPIFVLVTVIIAAAGNVINDIVDVEIDKINKPDKWIVGNSITVKNAIGFYYFLVLLGAVFAFYVAYEIDKYYLLFLYVFAVFFLYLYSRYLKRVFLLGNILVSLFSAGVIGIILVFEYKAGTVLKGIAKPPYDYINDIFLGFMFFSFFATMYRELVKDMEDVQGDKFGRASTVPVVLGINKAKYTAVLLVIVLLIALIYWFTTDINTDKYYFRFYEAVIVIPYLLLTLFLLVRAKGKEDFSRLSKMIKGFMLLGILMLWFYFF